MRGRSGEVTPPTGSPWQFGGEACVVDVRDLRDSAPTPGTASSSRRSGSSRGKTNIGPWDPATWCCSGAATATPITSPFRRASFWLRNSGRGAHLPPGRPRSRVHGVLGGARRHDIGNRRATWAAAGPGRADPFRGAQAWPDLDGKRDRAGGTAADAVAAFYAILSPKSMPGGEGAAKRVSGLSITGESLARSSSTRPARETLSSLGRAIRRFCPCRGPARRPALPPTFHQDSLRSQSQHARALICTCSTVHRYPSVAPALAFLARALTMRPTPQVREWLADYERAYGRGTSDVTTEQVPLSQTCGPARVIDVKTAHRQA